MNIHSEEQLRAITSAEPRFTVRAAAGSGKTRVLTARYLWHVEQGLRPDQILTITFTRKAAAEMKRRIVDALREQGRADDAQIAETKLPDLTANDVEHEISFVKSSNAQLPNIDKIDPRLLLFP